MIIEGIGIMFVTALAETLHLDHFLMAWLNFPCMIITPYSYSYNEIRRSNLYEAET